MRAIKILTAVMGVLIIVGTIALVVVIARRLSAIPGPAATDLVLAEPAGSRILGIAAVQDRLAIALGGGGRADRVVLIDPRLGKVVGRIGLGP